jgi:hypothetical protein
MWRRQRQKAGVPRRRDAAEMRAPYAIVTSERYRAWLCRAAPIPPALEETIQLAVSYRPL